MDSQPNEKDLAELIDPVEVPRPVSATVEKPIEKSPYALILGFRRIKEGPFSGLWELTKLSGEVSVDRVVMDASTRASIIALATNEILKAQ